MRAVVYLRQSKDKDGDELAVTRQREDCRRLVTERGWTLTGEFVDNDRSASNGKARPEYERMLAAADRREFDVIVVAHVDRLTRRLGELVDLIPRLEAAGVRVATVSGDLNLDTDAGRLVARILGSVAQGEVERKSTRQKRAALQAAQQGRPRGGPRAFAYEPDGLTVRPDEAGALKAAYRSLLDGGSLSRIARDLTDAGHRTGQGKPFTHNAARAVLLNPRNAGLRAYNNEIVGKAQWPQIVDEDTWRTAHALITDPTRRRQDGTARRWLLGGLALCGRCADGTTVRVNYRERDATGQPVRIYRCRTSSHLSRAAEFCDWRVAERVIARLSRDDARDLLVDDDRPDLDELRAEASALRLRLEQLAEAFADGTLTAGQLKAGTERLRARLADVDARMVHIDRAPVLADLVTADDVRATWHRLPIERQRAVVDILYAVTLLPRGPGRGDVEVESVRMEAKT
jgi:site-specific DNA recombinase